jgi:ankyrin repeat protein
MYLPSFHEQQAEFVLFLSSHAVGADRIKLVKWLLENGADPNENSQAGLWTCLDIGVVHASIETVELLLKHGANIQNTNSLLRACVYGRIEMINLLLDYGIDVNEIPDNELTTDRDRKRGLGTALHIAARKNQEEVVRVLLKRGADRAMVDSLDKTVLDIANMSGHKAIVELLREPHISLTTKRVA